jgi:uncharacterized membrane protein YozB (DUF420 family)
MIDRFINVLTFFILALSAGVLLGNLYDQYTSDYTDWWLPFVYAAICLAFLVVPLTINYIRHGEQKLWNKNTLNK